MENWCNTAPPAMTEELTSHVHGAASIFSRIATEAGALVVNQEVVFAALNEVLVWIQTLEP